MGATRRFSSADGSLNLNSGKMNLSRWHIVAKVHKKSLDGFVLSEGETSFGGVVVVVVAVSRGSQMPTSSSTSSRGNS